MEVDVQDTCQLKGIDNQPMMQMNSGEQFDKELQKFEPLHHGDNQREQGGGVEGDGRGCIFLGWSIRE